VFFHSFPRYTEGLLLALVVWFLYLLDRQVDNIFQPLQDDRHHFHFKYQKLFWVFISLLGLSILCLLPFQSLAVIQAGFSVLILVFGYAYTWHKGWLQREKELFTAILYGLGVTLIVWVREPSALFFTLPLVAMAYQNLCYFNLIEADSVFYRARLKKTEWILIGLLSGLSARTQDLFIVLPFLVTFGLTFLFSRFSLTEENRFWGDLAFWSPLIYLLHGIFST
jgi:hypothetical protein